MGFAPAGPSTPPPIWEQAMGDVNDSVTSTEMFFVWFGFVFVLALAVCIIERLTRHI